MTNGKMVEFNTSTGKGIGYFASPKETSRGNVLVLHAWWGLNDFFKSFADRLAGEGYTVLAPDLRQGKVAKTVDEAKVLMEKSNEEVDFPPILLGGLDYLQSQTRSKGDRTGAIGFSMGASWALWLAAQKPSEIGVVTTFYGAYVSPKWDFTRSRASFLGHYSPDDEWEPVEGVKSVEEKLKLAGRPVEFHFYPGTKHWFFEKNRAEYSPDEAGTAWMRTLEFLRANVG